MLLGSAPRWPALVGRRVPISGCVFTQINAFNTGVGEIADHGLAVDDLLFIGDVPEPSTLMFTALAVVAMLGWRRER